MNGARFSTTQNRDWKRSSQFKDFVHEEQHRGPSANGSAPRAMRFDTVAVK